MRSQSLAYKFLQSFLVVLVFLSVLSVNSTSYAIICTDRITIDHDSTSLPSVNLGVTLVPTFPRSFKLGIKPWSSTGPHSFDSRVEAAYPWAWGTDNALATDSLISGLSSRVYSLQFLDVASNTEFCTFNARVGPSTVGTVSGSPITISNGYSISVSQPAPNLGNVEVTTNFLNPNSSNSTITSITLSVELDGAATYTTVGTISNPGDSVTWDHSTYPILASLPEGNHTFRVEADATELSGFDIFSGLGKTTTFPGTGTLKYIYAEYTADQAYNLVLSGTVTNPILSNTGFTITPSQPVVTAGDVDVYTGFSIAGVTLDELSLYVQPNQTGLYSEVTPAVIGANSNTWLASSHSQLQFLVDGTHNFRAEGDYFNTSDGLYYTYYGETSFNLTTLGGAGTPVIFNDAFDWVITEDNGNLTIETTQKDAGYTLNDIALFRRQLGSALGVGSFSAPTPISPVLIWDHPTYPSLAGLSAGLYTFAISGMSIDASGIHTQLSGEIDFYVNGEIIELIIEEPLFGSVGVTANDLGPSTNMIRNMSLFVKLTSEPDSAYQLVRTDTNASVGDPFLWGMSHSTETDPPLVGMLSDSYTFKVEATIPDQNNLGSMMTISKELEYTLQGSPIEFSYIEDKGSIGIMIVANHPEAALGQEVRSVNLEVRQVSPTSTTVWTPVRLDESGRSGASNPYLFGIINPAEIDKELVNMCSVALCEYEARVTSTYILDTEHITALGPGVVYDDTLEVVEVHPFEVRGLDMLSDHRCTVAPPHEFLCTNYLIELFKKEFKFLIEYKNNDINTLNKIGHIGVQLVPTPKLLSGNGPMLISDIQDLRLFITKGAGARNAVRGNVGNVPSSWVWGTKTGITDPELEPGTVGGLADDNYTIDAQITIPGGIIFNKIETVRPAADVELKCTEVYNYTTGLWECPPPATYTDDKILGDKIGNPNDLNIPVP